MESRPTVTYPTNGSMLESADLELESADSSTDSKADAAKVGMWVRAFSDKGQCHLSNLTCFTINNIKLKSMSLIYHVPFIKITNRDMQHLNLYSIRTRTHLHWGFAFCTPPNTSNSRCLVCIEKALWTQHKPF